MDREAPVHTLPGDQDPSLSSRLSIAVFDLDPSLAHCGRRCRTWQQKLRAIATAARSINRRERQLSEARARLRSWMVDGAFAVDDTSPGCATRRSADCQELDVDEKGGDILLYMDDGYESPTYCGNNGRPRRVELCRPRSCKSRRDGCGSAVPQSPF